MIKLLFCIITLVTCDNINHSNNKNYTTMKWKFETPDLLTAISKAKNEKALTSDLAQVYSKIQNEHTFKSKEILAYIDATNGIIYFSGLEKQNGNDIDTLTISFEIPDIWEQYIEYAPGFDELALTSLKKALTYNEKEQPLITTYKIIAETELGDKTNIN
ncbi:MAG: hypothetical protein IPM95_04255 [Sphingobacteriales bacterium]|nr:hypothetical protein [Sphingobacteriales bacterium]